MQLVQAVILWQLGTLAKTDSARLRPIIAAFCMSLFVNAVLSWMYFFAIPVAFALLIAICLLLAYFSAKTKPA
jgi:hypothetical protein